MRPPDITRSHLSIPVARLDRLEDRERGHADVWAQRADIHQVLAYASLFDADEIVATLDVSVAPVDMGGLECAGPTRVEADLSHSGRNLRVTLEAIPFGGIAKVAAG